MPTTIVMPQLGESVAEGVIGKWLKQEGDQIAVDEPIVEVITDKVNAEIPSPVAGTLQKITQPEGATVAVGQEIAVIGDAGGSGGEPETAQTAVPQPAAVGASAGGNGQQAQPGGTVTMTAVEPESGGVTANAVAPETPGSAARSSGGNGRGDRVRSSPLVRRLAEEHGINLAEVPGTGIGGRVSKQDILLFVEQKGKAQAPAAPTAVQAPPTPQPAPAPQPAAAREAGPREERIPVSPLRKMIADRMEKSVYTIPHASTIVEVDMTNVMRYRDARKDEFRQREGVPLSLVAFFVKAAVEGLKQFPDVNSEWAGDAIIRKLDLNINVAVDAPDGLTTPVIKKADELSLAGLTKAIVDLATRAREKKLKVEDMQGGTFTVNNTGALGSVEGVSIINYPQAAILSFAAIVKRPVIVEQDGQDLTAVRHMMNLCLSFDHRILDGGSASAFLVAVKKSLENWPMEYPLY